MGDIAGWYYLHTNGDLIYKPEFEGTAADIRESPFAVMLWPINPKDRESAWRIVVEALASGAEPTRVKELADKWGCDDADAEVYAGRIGVILTMDGNQWCATGRNFVNLQESPAGFGDTALGALAELCRAAGFRPYKMWGTSFAGLVNA